MTRVNKGKKGGLARLVCVSNNESRGCDFNRLVLDEVVVATKEYLKRWDFASGLEALMTKYDTDKRRLIEIDKDLAKLGREASSTAITDAIIRLARERKKLVLRQSYDTEITPKRFLDSIESFINSPEPKVQNSALRQVVSSIVVHGKTDLEVYFRGREKAWRFNNLNPTPSRRGLSMSRT